ncbi:MAG: ATP phosphoribosyltransferase regulatory subunit, partial [Bauldia sp.]
MSASFESLRALFADAGYGFVEPPIVFPASVFVEVAGEDLRRRLFLTSAEDGAELALRPDYTIPVCLTHLAAGPAKRRADYAYLGPVFRQRSDGPGEFLQAGVESLGRTDRVGADADVLALAFAAAKLLAIRKSAVFIGDSGLFSAVLQALDLSPPWRRRLARAFGDPDRLRALIAKANDHEAAAGDMPPALAGASRARVKRTVDALFAATGLGVIGARNAEEIAERFIDKEVLAKGIDERAAVVLSEFLAIAGTPSATVKALKALARRARLDLGPAIARFAERIAAFADRGIDVERLAFAADFGRRLDYYSGFVFEFRGSKRDPRPVIGGGRYDRLMSLIPRSSRGSAKEAVPAVGFAIWLDRIGGRAASPPPGGGRSTAKRPVGGDGAERRLRSTIHPTPA